MRFSPPPKSDDRERFVIAPHHPDRLLRPTVSLGTLMQERFQQALTWNVFRTLELVSPAFWLRRFHLRLTGEATIVAPQIASVHLWHRLPLPPIQRIDGARPDVVADVIIETEHAVWTLVAASACSNGTDSDLASQLVDAGAWFAGARQHYCGVLETDDRTSAGSVLQARYARSRDSGRLRSATRGPAMPMHVHWGAIRWTSLSALMYDCCEETTLPGVDRALARNALQWLMHVGVLPGSDDVKPQILPRTLP